MSLQLSQMHSGPDVGYQSRMRTYVRHTYRLCRSQAFFVGGTTTKTTKRKIKRKNYCQQGEDHTTFMDALIHPAVRFPEPLGRRRFPMAAHSTVVAVGNPHTRRTIMTLRCHFDDEIVAYDKPCWCEEQIVIPWMGLLIPPFGSDFETTRPL